MVHDGPRAALPLYEGVLASAQSAGDRRHEGLALGHLGTVYKNLGDYARAMDFHARALAIKRTVGDELEVGKTLNNMGLVEEAQGRCDKALALYAESLAIFTRAGAPALTAPVLNNEGLCYDALGDFQHSRSAYERALAIQREQKNDIGASEALGNLGGVSLLLGRYDEAAARYDESLAISTRLEARQSMVADLINLGLALLGRGDVRMATARLQQAKQLAGEAGLLREEADAERGLSQCLEQTGRYDAARTALSNAAHLYDGASLARESVETDLALGELDLSIGDVGAAAAQFERAGTAAAGLRYYTGQVNAGLAQAALELRRNNAAAAARAAGGVLQLAKGSADGAATSSALLLLARVRMAEGHSGDAVEAGSEALAAARDTRGPLLIAEALVTCGDALVEDRRFHEAVERFDEALRLGDDLGPDLEWRAVFGRGKALEAQGQLEPALADYLRAVERIEQVRAGLASERARSGFLDDKRDPYSALARLLLRLGRTRAAFEVAERLRAQGYRELIARSLALGAAPQAMPGTLLRQIRLLQASLDAELRRSNPEQRGAAMALYRRELGQAEAAWTTAVDALASTTPWARELRREAAPAASEVQRHLPRGAALLEYLVARDTTVAFVITRRAVEALTLPIGSESLRTRIELLRALIDQREPERWKPVSAGLDEALLAPIRRLRWLDGITRLYVVPHAELNYLPFSALYRQSAGRDRFLVDDVAPVTLPSAAALTGDVSATPTSRELMALAPALARLPYAQQEVNTLAALFPTSHEVLAGSDATEARFKSEAGQFRVLHLATHGFFNRVDPLFSGVQLEPGGDDDGRLQVFEILGLRLGADLVTLSACETALGSGELSDLPAGEELVGLTRAFLSAGSRNVVASLWDISDRGTAPLMLDFYRAAADEPLAEALASAQRRRAHARGPEAHPWYWAAFVIAQGRAAHVDNRRVGP